MRTEGRGQVVRRLYAVGFEGRSGSADHMLEKLCALSEIYARKYAPEIRVVQRAESRSALWTLEAVLPKFGDRLVIRVARHEEEIGISLELFSPQSGIRPSDWAPRHLSLINDIIDQHVWTNVTGRVEQVPFDVGERQAFDFSTTVLRDPKRQYPAVVVSQDPEFGAPLIDDERLALQLAGMARVYTLTDKQATYNIAAAIGEKLGCHGGSVRIYWPGLSRRDEPHLHPMLFGNDIRQMPAGEAEDRIRSIIVAAARDQASEGRVHLAARKALAEQAMKLLSGMGLKELKDRVSEKESALEAKEDELQAMRMQVNALRAIVGRAARDKPVSTIDCRTADEVLRLAEARFSSLRFGSRAWRASDGYASRHLDELYDVLEALEDLARERQSGSLGVTLEAWLNGWGQKVGRKLPKFAAHESATTKGMHGDERDFSSPTGKVRMTKHFTIGKGDSEGCIQVYWEFAADGTVDIGYCGRHLSYATQR